MRSRGRRRGNCRATNRISIASGANIGRCGGRSRLGSRAVSGPWGGSRLRAGARRDRRGRDPKRASADDLDAVRRTDGALEQLHALSGPDDVRVDLQVARAEPAAETRRSRERAPGRRPPRRSNARISRAAGAPPCCAPGSHGPARELGGTDRSPSWTNTAPLLAVADIAAHGYRPLHCSRMSDETPPRRGNLHRQGRTGRDAQGRRDHGRGHPGAGQDRRGRRRGRRDGARARPRRHPPRRRRGPDVRPGDDPGDPGGGDDPGDGQGPDRPLRRGSGARGARGRLHRRVRGPDAGRRGQPHRQVGVQGPVRVRGDQPRRGAAADRRGRGDDPLQGRGRHRRHRRGRPPPAQDPRRDPPPGRRSTTPSSRPRPRSFRRRCTSCARSPPTGACPSCCSAPAGSRRRRTPRWSCSSAPRACSSARGSSSPRIPERRARGDRRGDDALPGSRRASRPPRPVSVSRW